ncbi:MAG: hypothetical protein PHZ26_05780 [Candidatus Gracilibacteria bacterium]|nr:hypothetical protein [Candidatus Gracilibacteria bacterium]MDD2909222.1 hypothetical protein [Candidatus Gracilibacteria bacterium]
MQKMLQIGASDCNELRESIIHGPIMILEILNIINSTNDKQTGKLNVISFVNSSPRELKDDTKTILVSRGFTVEEIPKLA